MRSTLIAISVVLTAAGLTRPEFAGRSLQLLVACITIILAAAIVRRRWGSPEPQIARPFVPPDPELTFGVETPDVTELVRSIEASDGRLPPVITKHLAEACRGRLADRHRLYFYSGADHDTIEALVSPAMWTVLGAAPDDAAEVSLGDLPRLLDEVDTL
jgi:hypothetical protein